MKKHLLIILLAALTALASTQTTEESDIKKVCESETSSWLSGDLKSYEDCWKVQPYSFVLVSLEDGTLVSLTADQISSPDPKVMGGGGTFENTQYNIRINGNNAWAAYNEVKTSPKGEQMHSKEVRMLEKIDGKWKIVGISVHHYKKP
jgi:hypothetical protein